MEVLQQNTGIKYVGTERIGQYIAAFWRRKIQSFFSKPVWMTTFIIKVYCNQSFYSNNISLLLRIYVCEIYHITSKNNWILKLYICRNVNTNPRKNICGISNKFVKHCVEGDGFPGTVATENVIVKPGDRDP